MLWVLDSQLERMLSSPERSIARDVANPVSTILDGVTEIHDHEWVVMGALSHASHAIISRMFLGISMDIASLKSKDPPTITAHLR